jgi:nicotinamide riboside transporter PnuC
MNTIILGTILGMIIGGLFAWFQWRAVVRYEKDMESGRLTRLPGAMSRVALLLLVLVGVQFILPPGSLWYVTGGLLAAMLLPMSLRLRRMMQHS